MRKFGLIGYPLSHSFSPSYFKEKFIREGITDASYEAFPILKIEDLAGLITNELVGLNVTIPYKEAVIPYMNHIDPVAQSIGAINTIKQVDGDLHGYNTDAHGFRQSLIGLLDSERPSDALVLGTGGSSKAVTYVLDELGINWTYVSRKKEYLTYTDLTPAILRKHLLVVNTTPLGMYPKVDSFPPLPYSGVTDKHFFFDLVYNPEKTLFLNKAFDMGAKIKSGTDMLHLQAEKSWQIWNHH